MSDVYVLNSKGVDDIHIKFDAEYAIAPLFVTAIVELENSHKPVHYTFNGHESDFNLNTGRFVVDG